MNGHLSSSLGIANVPPWYLSWPFEPFFRKVWDNPDISGLRLDDTLSPKIVVFADDFLFFVTNPLVSIWMGCLMHQKVHVAFLEVHVQPHICQQGALACLIE